MPDSPIFIHSLFRAGSTYLFSQLRRSEALFCYYESMHELVAWASEDVSRLNMETRADKMQQLHHPVLAADYFDELKQVWPAWQNRLASETVYGGYFAETPVAAGQEFFEALSAASPRRPVFSECRTAGRIGALKQGVGGHHAYLWRNPRDQWWSYQIDPYFDAAGRVIAHADPLPLPLAKLVSSLGWPRSPDSGFSEARDFYDLRPASFIDSYTWFYGLWLFTLDHALGNADLLINIDSLGGSPEHQDTVTRAFAEWGAGGIDLSDAASPTAYYSDEELEVFSAAEARVQEVFSRSGWRPQKLERLNALREAHQPSPVRKNKERSWAMSARGKLLASRADGVRRTKAWHQRAEDLSHSLEREHQRAKDLSHSLEQEHQRAKDLSHSLEQEQHRAEALRGSLDHERAALGLARRHIEELLGSASWRITAPLRLFAGYTGGFIRRCRKFLPIHRWLRSGVVLASSRFPWAVSQADKILNYTPRLRDWLIRWMGIAPATPVKKLESNPFGVFARRGGIAKLSPRGKVIYNQLARDLDMQELPAEAPSPSPEDKSDPA